MTAIEKLVFLLAKGGKREAKEQVNMTVNVIYGVLFILIGFFWLHGFC